MRPTHRVGNFTDEHLRRIAEDPSCVVMQPTYDVHAAWDPDEVEAMMDLHIRGEAHASDARVQRFRRDHPIMAGKFADAELMRDPTFLKVFRFMFEQRRRVARGAATATEAASAVSDRALHAVYTHQKRAEQ